MRVNMTAHTCPPFYNQDTSEFLLKLEQICDEEHRIAVCCEAASKALIESSSHLAYYSLLL
ncbi:hypothetical protein BDR03DRAFT_953335, partial [Suillus americanus]